MLGVVGIAVVWVGAVVLVVEGSSIGFLLQPVKIPAANTSIRAIALNFFMVFLLCSGMPAVGVNLFQRHPVEYTASMPINLRNTMAKHGC